MDAITELRRFDDTQLHEDIAVLAKRYCDLIDDSRKGRGLWLREVARLLPRLHAAMASVDGADRRLGLPAAVDLDARFDLYTRLRHELADRDSYWLEFDCAGEGSDAMTGSLADDLTDIYCELKEGLGLLDVDPRDALAAWSSGYARHWGQHLIDAERHLALLGAQERLEI